MNKHTQWVIDLKDKERKATEKTWTEVAMEDLEARNSTNIKINTWQVVVFEVTDMCW